MRHVSCHGKFNLRQLKLYVVNEMHKNSSTGVRLNWYIKKPIENRHGQHVMCF